MGEGKKTKSKTKNWTLAIIAFDFVIIAWLFSWSLIVDIPGWSPTIRGQFGDMFGAVNSLFSGLAFAGVIIAIVLQSRELELQRQELKLNRKELKATTDQLQGQKEQMELQNENLRKQNFENTFFQMVRLHNDIIQNMKTAKRYYPNGNLILRFQLTKQLEGHTPPPDDRETGAQCFIQFYYSIIKSKYWEEFDSYKLTTLNAANIEFRKGYLAEVGHYFRNLYHIIKLFDENPIENKSTYKRIIRAQLNNYELTVLFYNCLGDVGRKKSKGNKSFKELIEQYEFFENMDINLIIDPFHFHYFRLSAFGDQKEEVLKRFNDRLKSITEPLEAARKFRNNNKNQSDAP